MKKLVSMILALMMLCLPTMTLAEDPAQDDAGVNEEAEAVVEESEADEEEEEEEEEEEAPVSPFFGEWVCDNASIYIDEDEGSYSVFILLDTSDTELSIWEYTCSLDDATGSLTGTGSKTNEVIDEEGETVSSEIEYADGSATFTIDGDALIWADAKADIARGMRFVHSADDEVLVEADAEDEEDDEEDDEDDAEDDEEADESED